VRVLFDHNVLHKMRTYLDGHNVFTAEEMGWAELENGELLRVAEKADFPVMVTCDQNISYQQNLAGRRLALVVLNTNNWNVLKMNLEPVLRAVNAANEGSFQFVTV
jgi:predicted nuclease of predicted toxin-antitoxin system